MTMMSKPASAFEAALSEVPLPRNRAEARRLARAAVKRGAASGHVTREARKHAARALRVVQQKQKEKSVEDRAKELGLTVVKKEIEVP
jgi:hypothetical protein